MERSSVLTIITILAIFCGHFAGKTKCEQTILGGGFSEYKEGETACGFSSVPLLLLVFAGSIVKMRSTFAVLASLLSVAFATTYQLTDNHVGTDFLSTFTHEAIGDPTNGRV